MAKMKNLNQTLLLMDCLAKTGSGLAVVLGDMPHDLGQIV
jgi:hypothetical protein